MSKYQIDENDIFATLVEMVNLENADSDHTSVINLELGIRISRRVIAGDGSPSKVLNGICARKTKIGLLSEGKKSDS